MNIDATDNFGAATRVFITYEGKDTHHSNLPTHLVTATKNSELKVGSTWEIYNTESNPQWKNNTDCITYLDHLIPKYFFSSDRRVFK